MSIMNISNVLSDTITGTITGTMTINTWVMVPIHAGFLLYIYKLLTIISKK